MLLVICGAGASYDCVAEGPRSVLQERWRPPLTKDLFAGERAMAVANAITEARGPIGELQQVVSDASSVEQVLSGWDEVASGKKAGPMVQRRHDLNAVRWFLSQRVREVADWPDPIAHQTHYLSLVRRIEAWREPREQRVTYVTFNYDTLLDEALDGELLVDLQTNPDGYCLNPNTSLVKLHGSVNWWHTVGIATSPTVDRNKRRRLAIAEADESNISPAIDYFPNWTELPAVHLPAIAVPVLDKDGFECPDHHVEALRQGLEEVDRVLIIGWRAKEAKFVEMLTAIKGGLRLEVVTTSEGHSQDVADVLTAAGVVKPADLRLYGEGFSGFINEPSWSVLA